MTIRTQTRLLHGLWLTVVAIVLASLFTGCGLLCSNGEGYCGRFEGTGNNNDDPGQQSPIFVTTFFWFEDGFTCQDTAGNTLSSYKDAIEYEAGKYYSTGTVCDSKKEALKDADVFLSADGKSLLYHGNLYIIPD